MPSMSAVVIVLRTPMPTGFVTTRMTALEHSMRAACATAPARSTSVDVQTSLKATAIAMEISSTLWECAAVLVTRMSTQMASAMT